MARTSVSNKVQYNGNGATTVFAYTFPMDVATNCVVIKTSALGVETTLTRNVDYTLTINTDGSGNPIAGGNVTCSVAPATGEKLTIKRVVPLTQVSEWQNGAAVDVETLEDGLDKSTDIAVQLAEEMTRKPGFKPSSSHADVQIDDLVANRGLKVGADGASIVMTDYDPDAVHTAAAASAAAALVSENNAALSEANAADSEAAAAASAASAALDAATAASLVGNALVNTFTGNGATTGFTLSTNPVHESNVVVVINGVVQHHDTFSVSGTTLLFSEAPPNGSAIEAVVRQTLPVGIVSDGTITDVKVSDVGWAKITGKPTTVSGYGITDAYTKTETDSAITTAVANIIDTAPATLDTLNELAASLNDDANFAGTMTTALAAKAPLASPTFTGTVTSPTLNVSTTANLGNGSANYIQVTGGTGSPTLSVQGSSTNADLLIKAKGTGQVALANSNAYASMYVMPVTNAANFFNVYGATAGSGVQLNAGGTDANVTMYYGAKGAGAHAFNSANAPQFYVTSTTSAVNYLQVTGGTTGNPATLEAAGSDTNRYINIKYGGSGGVQFMDSPGYRQFVVSHTANADRYVTVTGGVSGSSTNATIGTNSGSLALAPAQGITYINSTAQDFFGLLGSTGNVDMFVAGSSANANMRFITRGGGAHQFYTNTYGTGVLQFSVPHTANAVNYIHASGAATTGNPYFLAAGSDTNIGLNYAAKGAGVHWFLGHGGGTPQFTIASTPSAVNYLQVTGAAAGGYPSFEAVGSDTNVGFQFWAKGTGSHQFRSGSYGGPLQFIVNSTAGATSYWTVTGDTGTNPLLMAGGSGTDVSGQISSKGAGALYFMTNGRAQTQFVVAHTASAVNYLQVSGRGTGNYPVMTSEGADTDVGMYFSTKGAAPFAFYTNAGNQRQLAISHTASAVNYVDITGAATGGTPRIVVAGSDTNIALGFTTKGTGDVSFNLGMNANTGVKIQSVASYVNGINLKPSTTGTSCEISSTGSGGGDANVGLSLWAKGTGTLNLGASTNALSFFAATGTTKQTITGSRGGNAALASLLTALANYGLITDSTTA